MAGMNLEIGGDASGALGALAATQAAIDGLHGKSVDVDVNVNGAGAGTDSLSRMREGSDRAGEAHDRHTASLGRNEEALGRHRDATERGTESLREHAQAQERASEGAREHGEQTERANDSLNRSAQAHDRAASSVQQHTEANRASSSSINETTGAWDRAIAASKAYTDERGRVSGLGRNATEDDKESLRTLGRQYTAARDDLRSRIGDDQFNQQWASSVIRGSAPQAATSSLARQELPSPTGVERAEAMRSATQRLESAQTQAAATAVAYRKAFDEAYASAPEGVSATESATQATRSLRDDMTDARADFRNASRDVNEMKKAFGETAQETKSLGDQLEAVTGPLTSIGMGAAIGAAGGGLIGAMTAGLGAGSALEQIKQTPGLMYQASLATRDFDKAFRQMGQEALQAGLPAMKDVQQAAGDLGKTLATIGTDNMRGTLEGISSLTRGAAHMAMELAPAVAPAEKAFVDLGNAAMQGIGRMAPGIEQLSQQVSQSAPGISQAVTGIGNSMTALAASGARGVSALGPTMEWLGHELGGTGPISGSLNEAAGPATDDTAGWFHQHVLPALIGQGGVDALEHTPILGSQGASANDMINAGLGSGATVSGYSDADYARGKQMGAVWAHTSPEYGTLAGDPAPLGAAPAPKPVASSIASSQQEKQDQQQAEQQVRTAPRHFGESAGFPRPEEAQQLASGLQQVSSASNNAQQSLSQIGSTATPSLRQVAQQAQQLPQQLSQPAQQAAQQMQEPLQQVAPQMASSLQQLPQQVQAPMQAAVKQVQQAAPDMASASQDLGSSIPSGVSQGVTKDEDETITVIKHMHEKIVEVAADTLDSHSPSQVFVKLGQSIPQGLAVGIQSQQNLATSATQQMLQGVTQQAQNQLGNQQSPLQQNQAAQQQAQQQQAAQQQYQNSLNQGLRNQWATPASLQQLQQQQQSESAMQQAQLAGIMPGLSPELQNKLRSGQPLTDADRQQESTVEARKKSLDRFGWTQSTEDRVLGRDERRAEEFAHKKSLQESGRAQAKDELRNPSDAMRKFLGIGPAQEDGKEEGKSRQLGVASGIRNAQGSVDQATNESADSSINLYKKKHGISSPATVWASIGGNLMAGLAQGVSDGGGGVGDALGAVSSGLQATASNNGLQVGYAYSDSIITGMQTVIKSADFQSSAIPQLASAMATSALGQLGDLGPAGGAGQIPKNLQVALSAGVPAQQLPPINVYLTNTTKLDGNVLDQRTIALLNQSWEDFANKWQQN